MTQAQREEKDHEDKRQRHCDTSVTEGNRDTEEWLYLKLSSISAKSTTSSTLPVFKITSLVLRSFDSSQKSLLSLVKNVQ